jgi:hypothetical protein
MEGLAKKGFFVVGLQDDSFQAELRKRERLFEDVCDGFTADTGHQENFCFVSLERFEAVALSQVEPIEERKASESCVSLSKRFGADVHGDGRR